MVSLDMLKSGLGEEIEGLRHPETDSAVRGPEV